MARPIDKRDFDTHLEVDDSYVYLRVGAFDIKVKHEDEGVVVDVYSAVDETQLMPLATCYAFDVDVLPEEHSDE